MAQQVGSDDFSVQFGHPHQLGVEAVATLQGGDAGRGAGEDQVARLQLEQRGERGNDVRNGDIVVALVKGTETTLKRFYREADGQIRLQPANSAMQPIFVGAGDLEIQGKLLAVLRKYKN